MMEMEPGVRSNKDTKTMTDTTVVDQDQTGALVPEPSAPGTLAVAGAASVIDSTRVHLFRGPHGILRATIDGDRSVLRAKVVCAFPLSDRHRYLSILDGKGKEACLIESVDRLDAASQQLVAEELSRFYRVTAISLIHRVRQEYRTFYWDVRTERGGRDFVVKWGPDTVLWLTPKTVQLEDVDGNRFIIPDIDELDPRSRKFVALIE